MEGREQSPARCPGPPQTLGRGQEGQYTEKASVCVEAKAEAGEGCGQQRERPALVLSIL